MHDYFSISLIYLNLEYGTVSVSLRMMRISLVMAPPRRRSSTRVHPCRNRFAGLSGHVLSARLRASTRMHVRKRKVSYFNCDFMASLSRVRSTVRHVANDALHNSTRFIYGTSRFTTPDSNACDSSLNAGSDRSRNDTARQTGSRPVIRGSRLGVS